MHSTSTLRAVALSACALLSLGANYRTPNFDINAPTAELARETGKLAERLRNDLAVAWLGSPLPNGAPICDLEVKIGAGAGSGATTITYDRGRVVALRMTIEGPLDRIRANLLPHEMTHLVLAFQFGRPVPRWFDEGGAVVGENAAEWQRQDAVLHDRLLTRAGDLIAMRRLLTSTDYPRDTFIFYAQAASLSRFLLTRSDRPTLLEFTRMGMTQGWDEAVNKHYQLRNVEALERAWLEHVRQERLTRERAAPLTAVSR